MVCGVVVVFAVELVVATLFVKLHVGEVGDNVVLTLLPATHIAAQALHILTEAPGIVIAQALPTAVVIPIAIQLYGYQMSVGAIFLKANTVEFVKEATTLSK